MDTETTSQLMQLKLTHSQAMERNGTILMGMDTVTTNTELEVTTFRITQTDGKTLMKMVMQMKMMHSIMMQRNGMILTVTVTVTTKTETMQTHSSMTQPNGKIRTEME